MTVVIIEKTGIKSSQRLKSLSAFVHRLHPLEGTFTPSSWLFFSSSTQAKSWKWKKREKKQIGPDSRKAKRKERRGSRDTYGKDMNKFFTIIYHNIYRLHDEKIPTIRRGSEPRQLQLCGVLERPSMNSGVYLLSTDFPEEILISRCNHRIRNISAVRQHWKEGWNCRFKREKNQKPFNLIVTEWTLSVSFRVLMRGCHILLFLVNLRFLYDKDEAVWSIIKIFLV